jgi:hypothetical protein
VPVDPGELRSASTSSSAIVAPPVAAELADHVGVLAAAVVFLR